MFVSVGLAACGASSNDTANAAYGNETILNDELPADDNLLGADNLLIGDDAALNDSLTTTDNAL